VAACAKQAIRDMWIEHRQYIREYGEDLPEVRNWSWDAQAGRQDADL
jgi:xylulose-5-phosphate/fructose-6-phosphate phosphoketolase